MSSKLKLKYLAKSILPNSALFYARRVRELAEAWRYWSAYVFKNGRALPPRSIAIELTYRCNLKCQMCPQATDLQNPESVLRAQMKESKELTTEEIVKIIDEAGAFGTKRVTVTGGEPFLRKDIIEILSSIKRNGMIGQIISNGGLMNAEYASAIVKIGIDKITFSLDGPEDIHNEIRQSKTQFQDLLNAVRSIQSEKKRQRSNVPDLTLNTTISSLNSERLNEIVDIAANEKVSVNYGYVFYTTAEMEAKTRKDFPATGGKIEDQDIPMSLRQVDVNALSLEIEQIEAKAASLGVKINIQPNLKSPEELNSRFYDDESAYVHHCYYPWFAMRINPYGEVYPCQMNVSMGNMKRDSLVDVWNNAAYVSFRKSLRKVGIWPKCTKCCALSNKLWDRLPRLRWYWDRDQKK
jgi:radical SAM protein with 4Fe4S-binding SPASM domain